MHFKPCFPKHHFAAHFESILTAFWSKYTEFVHFKMESKMEHFKMEAKWSSKWTTSQTHLAAFQNGNANEMHKKSSSIQALRIHKMHISTRQHSAFGECKCIVNAESKQPMSFSFSLGNAHIRWGLVIGHIKSFFKYFYQEMMETLGKTFWIFWSSGPKRKSQKNHTIKGLKI